MLQTKCKVLGVAVLLLLAQQAQAAVYKCVSSNGSVNYSNLPCEAGGGSSDAGKEVSTTTLPIKGADKVSSSFTRYMSSECASLYQGVQSAPLRGIKPDGQVALQAEYQAKCALEERNARQRQSELGMTPWREKMLAEEVKRRQQQEDMRERAMCANMRDTVELRRQHVAEFNPKELEAFLAFETTYKQKCSK